MKLPGSGRCYIEAKVVDPQGSGHRSNNTMVESFLRSRKHLS